MARKTPYEKLQTRINGILNNNPELNRNGNRIYYQGQLLISFNENSITYSRRRYYPRSEDRIGEADFSARIILSHETIPLISSSSAKPKNLFQKIFTLVGSQHNQGLNRIIIGATESRIDGNNLELTYGLYDTLRIINTEERRDENIRFRTRVQPLIAQNFGYELAIPENQIDWGVRLQEVIASGEVSQADIQEIANQLNPGENIQIVLEKQVNKQVSWLLNTIEIIIDEGNLTVPRSKELGAEQIEQYTQASIKGPEHLMEKILTDFGQHALFGVPALINTGKYVMNDRFPRAQFDLLLITSLGDIEVVELKRTDTIVLDFDDRRNKFYASSELSKAIAQTERYITSVTNDNDREYLINNQTVREYLNDELGELINVDTVRPTGLIIIGSTRTWAKDYDDLEDGVRGRITRDAYNTNCERAYRELKDSHKNIKIITYSDLVQSARMRLELSEEEADEND
ncbi:DUF4263 domain-containing protein [Marivirga arenosa]|uniref:DUF4263 domain-containing protein n=1 Tax=Marivirga arenosa TaxID=3059076 RepID=A0AA49GHX7_9BACT|nr:Shedu anti-phage system protein SduA domain-containing protein [Marivirga sp. ABR2-2]WKK84308.2 DUF4263 domain-containing protein [Marivirga sp. ABR2-2]